MKEKIIIHSFDDFWLQCPHCLEIFKITHNQSRNFARFIYNHRFCSICGCEFDWGSFEDLLNEFEETKNE